mmetsp:Transcript_24024/g.54205  ORF Transcript_24024/g.54205 Transcript_24024/m.54205 type:complete len:363 (-) Transcript_24024:140-1228(-)
MNWLPMAFEKEAAKFKISKLNKSFKIKEEPVHFLLFGWRRGLWDANPSGFKKLFKSIVAEVPRGSCLTMVNRKTVEEMDELLLEIGFKKSDSLSGDSEVDTEGGWSLVDDGFEHARLLLRTGDPIVFHEVEPVFKMGLKYTTAICLGSSGEESMVGSGKDSRVLSTLLILRKLCALYGQELNVVAENHEDQTPQIAMAPISHEGTIIDFVNIPTIVARTLVMSLAYPQIQDALTELVGNVPGSPSIDFIHPGDIGILRQKVTVGALQILIHQKYQERGVLVGYQKHGAMTIADSVEETVELGEADRVIIIYASPYSPPEPGDPSSERDQQLIKIAVPKMPRIGAVANFGGSVENLANKLRSW